MNAKFSSGLRRKFQKDPVLFVSGILAAASCALVPPSAGYAGYVNLRVLALLFCLMGIVAGMREAGAFDALSRAMLRRIRTLRSLAAALCALCFFMSMFLTNDVALVTVVPFTLLIFSGLSPRAQGARCLTLALETVAANLGSMLTPVGNPQNLFLFAHYQMDFARFLHLTAPYAALSFAIIAALCFLLIKNVPLEFARTNSRKDFNAHKLAGMNSAAVSRSFWLYLALFVAALLCVARLIHWIPLLAAVCAAIGLQDRRLFARIDYALLLTFVFFFVFVGNLGRIPLFRAFFEGIIGGREVLTAILASQIISNVPAALLLSSFTQDGAALVLGTNLGGLGTIVASMASLITYKFCPAVEKRRYLAVFSALNFGVLAVMYGAYVLAGRLGN